MSEREAVTGYDWREDLHQLAYEGQRKKEHTAMHNRLAAHIERLEAERDALLAEREAEALYDLAAGACVPAAVLHLFRLDRDAARDNAKRVLAGRTE